MNRYRKEVAQADRYDDKITSQGLLNGVRGDHPVAWTLTVDTPKTFSDLYDKALKYVEAEEVFKARYPESVPNAPANSHRAEKECRHPYKPAQSQNRDYEEDRRRPLVRSPRKGKAERRQGKEETPWREGEGKTSKKASLLR